MTTVYVCPGTADGEECGIWLTAPGYCWVHPRVALVPKDASALTGASADSYRDLFAQGDMPEEGTPCPDCNGLGVTAADPLSPQDCDVPCGACEGSGLAAVQGEQHQAPASTRKEGPDA